MAHPEKATQQEIVHRVMHLGKRVHGRLRKLFEPHGVHRGQGRLLHVLSEGDGATQSELAERMRIQPPSLTRMVKCMQQNGLVERRRDADDDRVVRVTLTDRGRELSREARRVLRNIEKELTAGFSERELAQISKLLTRMRDNLADK